MGPVTPDVAVVVPTTVAREPSDTETPGTTETTCVPRIVITVPRTAETLMLTSAEPVKLTTVVPAPAVTVPVTTTGTAVLDCPPPIQTTMPVALTDGPAVVLARIGVTVPLTTAETLRPGTTETI
jgi:hypothetical protein